MYTVLNAVSLKWSILPRWRAQEQAHTITLSIQDSAELLRTTGHMTVCFCLHWPGHCTSLCRWLWECSYSVRSLHHRLVEWRHGRRGIRCRTQSPPTPRPRSEPLSDELEVSIRPPQSPHWFTLIPIFSKGVVCLPFQNKTKLKHQAKR